MCGIAGVVALSPLARGPDRELLERMCGALTHRGPDEFGVFRDQRAGLSHARLSTIDVATGQQPLANEDDSLWLVFNGEIFNYIELREELLARGHRFRTQSDSEVVVHAYEAWGEAAFERFNGQWALALYDRRSGELVLSRDRVGMQPLYYAEQGGRVYFGSEIKALFAAPEIARELDPRGLGQVFTFWAPIAPQTVFRGVRELSPGHVRSYREHAVRDRSYWSPRYVVTPSLARLDEAAEVVRAALERAVTVRLLRADVPVGSYLSGGLDSSLLTALAQRATGPRLKTFSVRFEEDQLDETRYQRMMVERLGTDHHDLLVTRAAIAAAFPSVIWHAERPVLRTAPAPLFLLSELVRDQNVKVVLSGEGADELFAGYDLFREGKVRRFWARHPESQQRPRLLERLYPYLARSPVQTRALARQFFGRDLARASEPGFAHGPRWSVTSALLRLFTRDVRDQADAEHAVTELLAQLPPEFASWSPLAQDQYLECTTLLSPYVLSAQGDRMLMSHSVKGRFPYLDRDVIELANMLPDRHKLHVLDEKHVLKRVARELVPPAIVARRKQPYRAPDAIAFFGGASPAWVDELTSEESLRRCGIFEPRVACALLQKARAYAPTGVLSNTDNMGLVGLLSTQLLHHHFVEHAVQTRHPSLTTLIELEP